MYNPELVAIKDRFRLALRAAKMDQSKFAALHGFTQSYISQIIDGKLKANPQISQAIIEFTRTQMLVINQMTKEPI